MGKKLRPIFILVTVMSVIANKNADAEILYEVINLGTDWFMGEYYNVQALSINNNGQIAGGTQAVGGGSGFAILFDSSGNTNNMKLAPKGSSAKSINDYGQIIGYSKNSTGIENATLFDSTGNGNHIYLGAGRAYSNNNLGQIVGVSVSGATLFDPTGNGNNVSLGNGTPYAISNNGHIVGTVNKKAALFDISGNGNTILLEASYTSDAYSVNDSGQIVGYSNGYATVFDPSGNGNNITLESGYYSAAYSINNLGQIVGVSASNPGPATFCATLFDPTGNGNNIDLNTVIDPSSGWYFYRALDINDLGWIVGIGYSPSGLGLEEGFLLKPIPEPASILFLGMGIASIMGKRRST
jgi:hypothetical protein